VKIDGRLDEWVKRCPIPLLGPNQLNKLSDDYAWSPENLHAVGYLMWDETNLYAAFVVRDDVEKTTADAWQAGNVDPTTGDSVQLAFAPDRGKGNESASALELQFARGTGGRPLVVRPKERAGGLRSGHLYRDSSEMEVAIVRHDKGKQKGTTVYEMRMPLSTLGNLRSGIGSTCGLSIVVNDNDGPGRAARMFWGYGVTDDWSPPRFGCVTFVE